MDNATTHGRPAGETADERRPRADVDSDEESADATTLKFEGKIGVADDERGGDPYNHTGRFKRSVR